MKQTQLLTSLYRAQKQHIETRVSLEQTSQIHSNLPEAQQGRTHSCSQSLLQ